MGSQADKWQSDNQNFISSMVRVPGNGKEDGDNKEQDVGAQTDEAKVVGEDVQQLKEHEHDGVAADTKDGAEEQPC